MKKLLGVSIAAMLAVTPMMANAAGVNDREVATFTSQQLETPDTNIATTSYVKGAYNVLATELNNIGDDIDITANGNNLSTSDSIATNVATLDTKMGKVADLKSNTEGVIADGSVLKTVNNASDDLTKAVIAINNELAAKSDASTVTGTHNYISNQSVTNNLVALDDAMGKQDAPGNHIGATTGAGKKTLSENIAALDTAMGKITETNNEYAHLTGGATVAANLQELNNAIVDNDEAITTLNADANNTNSVSGKIKLEAQAANFTSTTAGVTTGTISAAINQVQANLNAANAASALENASAGGYYAAGANVNTAIVGVDAQVKGNQDAIAAINRTQIPLFGSWTTDEQTGNVTIATLTANTPVAP